MGAAVVASAFIGGGISYLGSQQQAEEVKKGTKKGTKAQMRMFEKQMRVLQAAVDAGEIDINTAYDRANQIIQESGMADPFALNIARGYLEDPSQVSMLPGYDFQFEQGEKALQNLLSSTTGGGLSGPGIKAATEYGQNFASTQIDKALQRLFPFIEMASGATTNLANLAVGRGTNLSDLRMRGAGGQAGAAGAAGTNISSAFQSEGENLANITGGMYSNIANVASSGIENYATLSALKKEGYTFS